MTSKFRFTIHILLLSFFLAAAEAAVPVGSFVHESAGYRPAGVFFPMAFAGDDDEADKPTPVDEKLFNELYDIIKKFCTGATCTGTTVFQDNGADVKIKYKAYMLDLDYKRVDAEGYNEKLSQVVMPDMVWYHYPDDNLLLIFKSKKYLTKFKSSVQLEQVKANGKLTKKEKDGVTVYTLSDYTNDMKYIYHVDPKTKLLVKQVIHDNASGSDSETTYTSWESAKIDRDKFNKPSGCTEKNGDNY